MQEKLLREETRKSYTIWLPKTMKEELGKEAKLKGLTLSAYMIILLERRNKNER